MSSAFSLGRACCCILLLLLAGLAQASSQQTLLIFGDSLSTGYGIDSDQSWPALLQQRLVKSGRPVQVINASRRGETSEGGLKRLQAALDSHQPRWVLLELGAIDGLRMRPLDAIKKNLGEMVSMIRASGATPILVGMELPLSFDPRYAIGFSTAFSETARETGSAFVPFLLQKIADKPELFLPDRLHPSAEAQPKLLEVVWPVVAPLLTHP